MLQNIGLMQNGVLSNWSQDKNKLIRNLWEFLIFSNIWVRDSMHGQSMENLEVGLRGEVP